MTNFKSIKFFLGVLSGAFLLGSVATAETKDWIVLFKAPELGRTLIQSRNIRRVGLEKALRSSNAAAIARLTARLGSRGRLGVVKKDLWIVRGAVITADPADLAQIQKYPNVVAVFEDTIRKWITDPVQRFRRPTREDAVGEVPWGLKAIKVPELRKAYGASMRGQGVRVGVLDTGIQAKHSEFGSVFGKIVFKDFINKMPIAYDDHGHGTHVAGTIAGVKVGVAPQVSLVIGKTFDAAGTGSDSAILEGMQWMMNPDGNLETEDHPHVVNNSWGSALDAEFNDIREHEHWRRAITAWVAAGIAPVFAAGNSSKAPNGSPGGLPEAISVASYASDGTISKFSSRGPNYWTDGTSKFRVFKPDFSAPGQDVISASPDNKYVTMSGTSMATPHATGAIALAYQVLPKIHPYDALLLLTESSVKKGDINFGLGALDAHALVNAAVQTRKTRSARR